MATVTGLTAERMLAIEAASVVDGEINTEGHLILTTHGGTEIDAGEALVAVPDASDTQKGVVELATDAEIETGTSTTRAITPAGLASVGIPQIKEDIVTIYDELDFTEDQLLDAFGRIGDLEDSTNHPLDPVNYMQSYLPVAYPDGSSVLILSTLESTAGGWDFGGKAGSVRTICEGATAHQTWQRFHTTSVVPEMWIRAGDGSGWSPWRIVSGDKIPDPTTVSYANVNNITATSLANLPNALSISSMVFVRDVIVQIQLSAWMGTGTGANAACRAGVAINGVDPPGVFGGTFADMLYVQAVASNAVYRQASMSMTGKLTAGTYTFTVRSHRDVSNGFCNYPILRVIPLHWAE